MPAYLPRIVDGELDRLAGLPAVLLDGPKAVGKTSTALRRATTVWRLDRPAELAVVEADPDIIGRDTPPVLIDEWHRFPAVWDAVRRAVDEDPSPGRFLLTGSAPTGPVHSGAARITSVRMRPMTLSERTGVATTVSFAALLSGGAGIGGTSTFGLSDYVEEMVTGGFPGVRSLDRVLIGDQLDGYLDRIVERDFTEAGLRVRRPAAVTSWLRAYAAATSSTASLETIRNAATRGETTPAKTTTQRYRDLLLDLRILDPVGGWQPTRSHHRRLTSSPKHHLADPALAARLLGVTSASLLRGGEGTVPTIADGPLLGALFESLVTLTIRTLAQAAGCSTYHLRNRDQREVDLIVQDRDERVLAIEVKLSPTVGDDDVQHLNWLADSDPDGVIDRVVITTGPRAYRRRDGVAVVPLGLLGP